MTFLGGAVIWAGYTIGWWGWLALTDRKPSEDPKDHWPSLMDLVVPGRSAAVDGLLHPKSGGP